MRLIDAVTAGALVLAMAAFLQSDAQASLPRTEQDNFIPRPPAILSGGKAPALPPVPKVRAKPAADPGGWAAPDDYPAFALQFGAQGAVGFRLYVDEKGKVSDCWITSSSGVQLLDDTVCTLLSERASFLPARNGKGQAVRDIFQSRFVWKIPATPDRVWGENSQHYDLVINNMGQITSCFMTGDPPSSNSFGEKESEKACHEVMTGMPSVVALAARNYGLESIRNVNWDISLFIDEIKAVEKFQRTGTGTTGAMIWNVGVGRDGTITDCTLVRQKGSAALLFNACANIRDERFVAAPETEGAPSRRNGWVVTIIGYKTGP